MNADLGEFLKETIDLAEADLEAGDTNRVAHHLTTMRIVLLDGGRRLGNSASKRNPNSGTHRVRTKPRKSSGGRPQTEEGKRLEDTIRAVLQPPGKVLHIQEITDGVEKKGVPLPGKGIAANMISHLRKIPDIERVGRGLYSLKKK